MLVHLNNVSGGVFGGDTLRLRVGLAANAQAQITTTGATRVYRPRPHAAQAALSSSFELGRDAVLEYLPDMLIPFRQARVLQQTAFSLTEGAALFCWDTLAPGRAAADECFLYEYVKIASDIQVGGAPVLTDRLWLQPSRWPPNAPSVFGSSRYLVTFVALRAGSTAGELQHLQQSLEAVIDGAGCDGAGCEAAEREAAESGGSQPNAFWGVTLLPAHGVLVRGMTESSLGIPGLLMQLWSAAKQSLCKCEAIAPRKLY